eukprot:Awhi_evm1s1052
MPFVNAAWQPRRYSYSYKGDSSSPGTPTAADYKEFTKRDNTETCPCCRPNKNTSKPKKHSTTHSSFLAYFDNVTSS